MKRPSYIEWCLTNACNLRCVHCVGMEKGELPYDRAIKLAGEIADMEPGWVILEGGEPLLRKEIDRIGGLLKERGMNVFVITNGNAFNEERFARLASFSPKVLFSIDGTDAETYESTKVGGSFRVALEWAKRCAEKGIFQGLTVVLSRKNLAQAEGFIDLTKQLGGKCAIFLPLKPFGEDEQSVSYYERNALSPAEHEEAISRIYSQSSDIEVFYDEPFLWNVAEKHGLSLSNADSGITIQGVKGCAASYSIHIQTMGDVRPCMFASDKLSFGNAAREPLAEIWERMQNDPLLASWADQKERYGACADCPVFSSCRGCLARTHYLTGDVRASDDSCPLACIKSPV